MSVIVDTSVWSLALRRSRSSDDPQAQKLQVLLEQGQPVVLLGVIFQEILQGIRDKSAFEEVGAHLRAFPMLDLEREDFAYAAELWNTCRAKGVQASTIDVQIAAACIRHDCLLLTADRDFERIAEHCPLQLV